MDEYNNIISELKALMEGMDAEQRASMLLNIAGELMPDFVSQQVGETGLVIISPAGYDIVSEENVGRYDQYRVTLRESRVHRRSGQPLITTPSSTEEGFFTRERDEA